MFVALSAVRIDSFSAVLRGEKVELDTAEIFRFYEKMSRVRAFEETVARAYQERKLPGLLHLSMGSEATAVGVMEALDANDKIYSSHRPHGHFLAAGSDPRALLAELAGMESGLCRGRGGSMHLMDERAVMATGVVGGTLSIALGHSLVVDKKSLVAVFFGDGAVQTGTFHETLNMASLWDAPLLLVCENNGKIEFSSRQEHTRVGDIEQYARLFGIKSASVDGCDIEAVYVTTRDLTSAVRESRGPALLVASVSMLRPHYEGDLRIEGEEPDPLERCIQRLVEQGYKEEELHRVYDENLAEMGKLLDDIFETELPADPLEDRALVFKEPWE